MTTCAESEMDPVLATSGNVGFYTVSWSSGPETAFKLQRQETGAVHGIQRYYQRG